jgi:L-iditol 2-dehydrogenase
MRNHPGLVAGEGVAVVGPGPIGLLGVAVAKALGHHRLF